MPVDGPTRGIDHVYYWTRDVDRAVAFYEDVLGLSVTRRSGREWVELAGGPIPLAIHASHEPDLPPSGTVVLRVDDLDRAKRALEQRGAVFDGHEAEVPGLARFATLHDPDGN